MGRERRPRVTGKATLKSAGSLHDGCSRVLAPAAKTQAHVSARQVGAAEGVPRAVEGDRDADGVRGHEGLAHDDETRDDAAEGDCGRRDFRHCRICAGDAIRPWDGRRLHLCFPQRIGVARRHVPGPHTLVPIEYYNRFNSEPTCSIAYVLDATLSCGAVARAAVKTVKEWGVAKIKLVTFVASPEGIKSFEQEHPDVDIVTAAIDEGLDAQSIVTPGLGDVGSRFFATD